MLFLSEMKNACGIGECCWRWAWLLNTYLTRTTAVLFLSLSVSFNEEQTIAVNSVTNHYHGTFRVWFHWRIFLFPWIGIAKGGNFQHETQRFCHVVKGEYCRGDADCACYFLLLMLLQKKFNCGMISLCRTHLAGWHNYFGAVFFNWF